jgi:hypothetical protein
MKTETWFGLASVGEEEGIEMVRKPGDDGEGKLWSQAVSNIKLNFKPGAGGSHLYQLLRRQRSGLWFEASPGK